MVDQDVREADLIQRAARGQVSAFEALVAMHRPRVLRTAYGVMGSAEEAEDVAQEVFVKVWQNLDTFAMRSSFASWLYRITTNTAIDKLRRRREMLALDDQQPPQELLARRASLPEDTTLRNDARERVRRAILELSPNARITLVLREYEQLSYKEIAEVLDIPIGTVMSRLNYARNTLRRILESQDS